MKKIVYTQSDGSVAVCVPCEGSRLATAIVDSLGGLIASSSTPIPVDRFLKKWPVEGVAAEWAETEDEFIARIVAKDVPKDTPYEIVADVTADREFRDAWVLKNGAIDHDFDKVKAIAHDRRRANRDSEFKPLDVEATIPAKAASAEAKQQLVRQKYDNIQALIDSAKSIDEVKAALNG